MHFITNIRHFIILMVFFSLGACRTTPAITVPPSYNAKALAEKWRASHPEEFQRHSPHPRVRPKNKAKILYQMPADIDQEDPSLQDNDAEIGRNKYSYPKYQPDEDNPYVYSPPSPTNYPADNDADYYYYPLYFSE